MACWWAGRIRGSRAAHEAIPFLTNGSNEICSTVELIAIVPGGCSRTPGGRRPTPPSCPSASGCAVRADRGDMPGAAPRRPLPSLAVRTPINALSRHLPPCSFSGALALSGDNAPRPRMPTSCTDDIAAGGESASSPARPSRHDGATGAAPLRRINGLRDLDQRGTRRQLRQPHVVPSSARRAAPSAHRAAGGARFRVPSSRARALETDDTNRHGVLSARLQMARVTRRRLQRMRCASLSPSRVPDDEHAVRRDSARGIRLGTIASLACAEHRCG
jgi:hypothetical protein